MLGGESGPRAQFVGGVEAVDAPDLGDEDGAEDGADALDGLDGLIAEVVVEPAGDLDADAVDLGVVELDQAAQRLDPGAIARGEVESVEELGALRSPQLVAKVSTPSLARTPWTWDLSPERSMTSLAR